MENGNGASQNVLNLHGLNEHPHDPVVTLVNELLENLSPLSSDRCIYRVPVSLRKVNAEAYTPRVVSIGPFHLGKLGFQAMEKQKLQYLQSLRRRVNLKFEDCVTILRAEEKKARNCYAETIELSSDEFIKVLLVDGCFILELLLRSYYRTLAAGARSHPGNLIDEGDLILSNPYMISDVILDMILLENQLPFFVLSLLYDFVSHHSLGPLPSILNLVHEFFRSITNIDQCPANISTLQVAHFVDLLRLYYSPNFPSSGSKDTLMFGFSPSATRLHEAGVKFERITSSCLLDLEFVNGVLKIPDLRIHDSTEIFFRNLIAFEQCHCTDRYIIHYMTLLGSIINTPADVDLLMDQGIITSIAGSSEDICALLNTVGKEAVLGDVCHFFRLCEDLNAYCKTPWNKWKATLKRDYFHTPWAVISIVGAIILLILTFIQAVCSLISLKGKA